jgi:hypothetical protein
MTDLLDTPLTLSSDIADSAVGDETVILHFSDGTYYGLDEMGTRIWSLLREGRTPLDICAAIAATHDAPRDIIEGDVRRFLGELVARRIVVHA